MFKRISLLAIAPAVVALIIAGCGGGGYGTKASTTKKSSSSSTSTDGGQGRMLRLSADPGGRLRFNTATLTARPGKVTIVMTNPSSAGMDHGIAVEGNGVDSDGPIVAPGKTATVTATLKKGTYEYYCPVPGHEQAGMKGTLTVR